MKYILSGTNRPASRSLEVSKLIRNMFRDEGERVEIIDLVDVGLNEIGGFEYSDNIPVKMKTAIAKVNAADGLVVVCPEYNGSMPGALKYFIDHWKYPESYEFRPVAFVGLGGLFGGLRPVEHLQGVFGYRNAFIYPERVFLHNIWTVLKDGTLTDTKLMGHLQAQVQGFRAFVAALQSAGLDANSRLRASAIPSDK